MYKMRNEMNICTFDMIFNRWKTFHICDFFENRVISIQLPIGFTRVFYEMSLTFCAGLKLEFEIKSFTEKLYDEHFLIPSNLLDWKTFT